MAYKRASHAVERAGGSSRKIENENMIILLLIAAYVLPWIVAKLRHKKNSDAILMLDLLLGWTLIGWVVALVWAFTKD